MQLKLKGLDLVSLRDWLLARLPPDAALTPRLLLSVSGGVDSMVLWALIRAARIPHEILHVNFGLRAEESDGDEGLVRGEAREYDVV